MAPAYERMARGVREMTTAFREALSDPAAQVHMRTFDRQIFGWKPRPTDAELNACLGWFTETIPLYYAELAEREAMMTLMDGGTGE